MQTISLEARRRQRIVKELENSPEVEGRNGRPRQVLLNEGLRESVVDGSPVARDAQLQLTGHLGRWPRHAVGKGLVDCRG